MPMKPGQSPLNQSVQCDDLIIFCAYSFMLPFESCNYYHVVLFMTQCPPLMNYCTFISKLYTFIGVYKSVRIYKSEYIYGSYKSPIYQEKGKVSHAGDMDRKAVVGKEERCSEGQG